MKKIISIVAFFALLVSFADLAMAKKKHRYRHEHRGSVVSDTVKVGDDAVRDTGKVAGKVLRDTGNAVGSVFR